MHVRLAHVIFRDKCVFLNVKDFEDTNENLPTKNFGKLNLESNLVDEIF